MGEGLGCVMEGPRVTPIVLHDLEALTPALSLLLSTIRDGIEAVGESKDADMQRPGIHAPRIARSALSHKGFLLCS